jgi:SecD/SecF fusion protein
MQKKGKERKGVGRAIATFWIVVAAIAVLVVSTFSLIKDHINLGLDLRGGFEILYQVEPLQEGDDIDMTAVVNSLEKRINVLGVSEPEISVEGDDRIRVQLAGVTDQESARQMLGTTANLTFRDVDDNELADASILEEGGASLAYQDGQPVVSIKVADEEKFAEITSEIASKSSGENIMVIWLDYEEGDSYQEEAAKAAQGEEPKYISAATVDSEISGDCIISGSFTEEEARNLANLINSGSLPVKLTEISSNVVSASYGSDALEKTALAGFIGILLVMAFMIFEYRMPGVLSCIMLVLYIWAVFGLYALMGATFTLSGIGALVLGIGMTVDANIINFERIRQELYKGHSVRQSVAKGQQLSFSAVFDAQFTTLIAALIMYIWGNGAVKGFATMLIITVVMTLVINVGFSKWLLDTVVKTGIADDKPGWFHVSKKHIPDVSKGEKQFYTGTHHLDYMSKAKYQITVSIAIICLAVVMGIVNAVNGNGFLNLGIDFSSGTTLTVTSDEPITIDEVSSELEDLTDLNFTYQAAGDYTVYATTKTSIETSELETIKSALTETFGQEPGDNVVTPVVGRDLVRNAFILTIVAWIAMMLYVTLRYEWQYALGCIVALIHDVLIVLAVFGIARFEVNTEVVSVLLTIIGYSINNSIVVFDRIRENMAGKSNLSRDELKKVVNESLDETILMSLYSSLTTILPVIVLLILGSHSIFTFMFAMFIGLIAGTLSSIFIAPSVWIATYSRWGGKKSKKKKGKNSNYKEKLDEYTFKGINA